LRLSRKLTAPLSVILLVIIAGLAFVTLQSGPIGPASEPHPILDPNFDLWVEVAGTRRLMVWELEYIKGPGDSVSLQQMSVDGRRTLEFLVFGGEKDGKGMNVYLRQTIDGTRLAILLKSGLDISIIVEPCGCGGALTVHSVAFGVEVNDGNHLITFVFSDETAEPQTFFANRIVFFPTAPGKWAKQHIDLAKEYNLAQWKLPERITFSLVFGVGANVTGWHRAYVEGFSVPMLRLGARPQEIGPSPEELPNPARNLDSARRNTSSLGKSSSVENSSKGLT